MNDRALALLPLLVVGLFAGCSGDPETPAPQILRFEASKTELQRGERVTLSWEVTGAVAVAIDDDTGRALLTSTPELTGSVESPAIDQTSTFVLTAVGPDGRTDYDAVTLRIGDFGLQILRFDAAPNPAALTASAQLSWTTQGATSVEIFSGETLIFTAPAEALAMGSTPSPALLEPTTVFTLVATDGAETERAEVSVAASTRPAIRSFVVRPSLFTETSTQVTVSWSTSGATRLALTANGVVVPELVSTATTGTLALSIPETTTFELTAEGLGLELRARATSGRAAPELEPNDDDATATPLDVAASGTLTLDDLDVFSFMVPEGGSVFAELSDGRGGCPFEGLLTLSNSTGRELGRSDVVDCARIDPRRAAFATQLPGGRYSVSVESPANEVGPYALLVVVEPPACGNGIIEGAEACDDGPGPAGGQCTPTCERIVLATVAPPGGDRTLTLPAGMAGLVKVVLTKAGQSIEARASDALGGCTIESRLTLLDEEYARIDSRTSDVVTDACAAFEFPAFDYHTDLAAGTYYLDLLNETSNTAAMRLSVVVHDAACGNGAVEPSQGEQCDAGDLVPGDGCDSSCRFETLGALTGPPAEMTYSGAISPADQIDFYAVTLTAPGYITAETFIPVADTCTSTSSDTVLSLYTADFTRLIATEDGSLPAPCERIAPRGASDLLPAGEYRVGVRAFGGRSPVPSYAVRIQVSASGCGNRFLESGETCDDGNVLDGDACPANCQFPGPLTREVEPNELLDGTATPSGATRTSTAVLLGSLEPLGDVDVYAVDIVDQPADLSASTHTAPGDVEICDGVDTRLALFDAQGDLVVMNDDGGAGTCSRLAPAANPQVVGLAPGRYYLQVRHYDGSATVPVYFLTVGLD